MIQPSALLRKLDNPTDKLLEAYFRREDPRFAGTLFNSFGSNPSFALTPDDLLAVGFLDEAFNAEAALKILVEDRATYEQRLHEIPPDVDLWDAEDGQIGPESAASVMWSRLDGIHGVGPVRAGKLMARKRPRLIPIWDSVVAGVIQAPEGQYWATLREILRSVDLRESIECLRPAGISPLVSTLRLLDIAIWMWESDSEAARAARLQHAAGSGSKE